MATLLYCESAPELRLGPGSSSLSSDDVIRFREGWARVEDDDPNREQKLAWARAGGTPHIEIMDESEGRVNATAEGSILCGILIRETGRPCDKAFGTEKAVRMHRLSHAPRPPQA